MNQRDRAWATFIIWFAFLIAVLLVFDRLLMIPADFSGLWPSSPTISMVTDAETVRQAIDSAREAVPAVMEQVEALIRAHLAQRMPIALALLALLTATASACTFFVWRKAGLEAYLAREAVHVEKAKRRSRIETFVETLAPDELDQLRARLGDEDENEADARR